MFDPVSVHYVRYANTKGKLEPVGEDSDVTIFFQVSELCSSAAIPTLHSSLAKVANLQSCTAGRLCHRNEEGRNRSNVPGHFARRRLYEGRKLRSYLTENTACLCYKDQSVAVI